MGVRYIGGCCGFQPYHIRAIAEEVVLMNKSYVFTQLTTPPNGAFGASRNKRKNNPTGG